jgi:histidyl-tRNA synthetase
MDGKITPRVPRGMRDFLPQEMLRRNYVMKVIRDVFEAHGFEPLQTPALELAETLTGKYGPDAERLMYHAFHSGESGDELRLRYDLSVPFSRVAAQYPELLKPFKRYQIAPVWRAERPQKGRYREFYQCDADTLGSASMLADAEIIAVICEILTRLGFANFVVTINHRKILNGIGQYAGVPDAFLGALYRAIDKLPKIGLEGVRRELRLVGLPDDALEALQRTVRLYLQGRFELDALQAQALSNGVPETLAQPATDPLRQALAGVDRAAIEPERVQEASGELLGQVAPALREAYTNRAQMIPDEVISRLLSLLQVSGENRAILAELRQRLADYPVALEGIDDLAEILRYLDAAGIPARYYQIDFAMVRGLEYYTGPIYETVVKEPAIGSITGGGRYDELVGLFTAHSYPATGTTMGIERIIDVMQELDMFPPRLRATVTQVLMTRFSTELVEASLQIAQLLRQAGLNTEFYFDDAPLGEQIRYALKKEIPYVVILGPDELQAGQATARHLAMKQQETVDRDRLAGLIQAWEDAGIHS